MTWNIGKIVEKRAVYSPTKVAVNFDDTLVTYKELNERANRTANFLRSSGLQKGDRLGVDLRNCLEFLDIYFAAAKLGIILVPLNFRLVSPELRYQLNNCGARMLIFHDSFLQQIELIRKDVQVEEDKFIFVKGTSDGQECPEWARPYESVIEGQSSENIVLESPVHLEDIHCIIYTSGTTGNPKGVMVNHNQTYYKVLAIHLGLDMRSDDVALLYHPLIHSLGLFVIATPLLAKGGTLVLRSKLDRDGFIKEVEKYRATIILQSPPLWKRCLDTGQLDNADLSSVRISLWGAAGTGASIELFENLTKRGLNMVSSFGQTEFSYCMIMPSQDSVRKWGSLGYPGFFNEVWVQDSQGNRLPPGEIGEIVGRSPTIMSGYWNMPEQTAKTIVDGALHTGDLAYMDDEGYFYFVSRDKDMYKSGGENVYPAQIEAVLLQHPKIAEAAIVGVPDEQWGETGKAFLVLHDDLTITKEEIHNYLHDKVARYKYPSQIEIVKGELPKTASGKTMKHKLLG